MDWAADHSASVGILRDAFLAHHFRVHNRSHLYASVEPFAPLNPPKSVTWIVPGFVAPEGSRRSAAAYWVEAFAHTAVSGLFAALWARHDADRSVG